MMADVMSIRLRFGAKCPQSSHKGDIAAIPCITEHPLILSPVRTGAGKSTEGGPICGGLADL
jgi:hypothetical protein